MSSRRKALAIGAVALAAAATAGLFLLPGKPAPAPEFTFRTETIALPFDDAAFPEAPGADAVRANCAACHSAAMILSQPKLTPAQWQAEVEKMQKAYHAPVQAKDVPAILSYLEGLKPRP